MKTQSQQPSLSHVATRLLTPQNDIWQIHHEAVKRKQAGEDILLLSLGDPDFATPDAITQLVINQIRSGRTHYSPPAGEPELLRTLTTLEQASSGRPLTPENFTVFPGATAAIYTLLRCIADAGDEILVPDPMYIGYRSIFESTGVNAIPVPMHINNQSLTLNPADLKARLGPRTRAVLVNTPGNPCGNIISADILTDLARWTETAGLWLLCDEVYSLITFDSPHISLLKCDVSLDHIAVIDGLSKSHAMSGWRVGWVVSGSRLRQALARHCEASIFGCSQFIQDAAAFALQTNLDHVETMRQAYQNRRDLVLNRIAQLPPLKALKPHGGMFVMLDVRAIAPDGEAFARTLLDLAGISVLPGSGFGATLDGFVRIGLVQPEAVLERAMARLALHLPAIISHFAPQTC